jgi:hypothetical protein
LGNECGRFDHCRRAEDLPLHYAAKSRPGSEDTSASFPAFYSKYVIDELLYKYPKAASIQDSDGYFPLTLAVKSGKQWIGGGIKNMYDAYPDALDQINLNEHATLKREHCPWTYMPRTTIMTIFPRKKKT